MKRIVFILVMVCLALISGSAQQLKLIAAETGLSNTLINQLYQDSYGYIWITTECGLCRYDGENMTVYRASANETSEDGSSSINSDYVHKIFEDSKGRIWIGSIVGLQLYDRQIDAFWNVPLYQEEKRISAHVTDIVEDHKGNIWIATSGRGVLKYDGEKAVNVLAGLDAGADFVSSMICDKKGRLWIVASSNRIIYRYDIDQDNISFIRIEGDRVQAENSFVVETNGDIYLSADNTGLYKYDEHATMFRRTGRNRGIFISAISSFNDNIFVGTDGDGLYRYMANGEEDKLDFYIPQIDFSKAKIHSVLFDNNGNMWLAIFQKGIVMVPHSTLAFECYGYRPNSTHNIGSSSVMSILSDDDGLWVGTDGEGLYRIDAKGNARHVEGALPKTIMGLAKAKNKDIIYIAGYDAGLLAFNKQSGQITDMNHYLASASPSYNGRVVCIEVADDGMILVGTYGSGFYTIANNVAKAYVSTSEIIDYKRNEPVNNWINTITIDNEIAWVGTYKGISCFDMSVEKFMVVDLVLQNSINGGVVFDITKFGKNEMWIATNNGLLRYKSTNHEAQIYRSDNGLAADVALSVANDESGNMWIGTNKGLSKYDSRNDMFSGFYAFDGLQGEQFSRDAVALSADGKLCFGGTSGLTCFYPDNVTRDKVDMRVEVIDLYLNGRKVSMGEKSNGEDVLTTAVIDADRFNISYAEKAFSIDLSSFNFVNPEHVVYEYMLDGFDTEWHHTPMGISQISFTNLQPGEYVLNLRSRLGNSISPLKKIIINISPLWWQTKWALLIYFAIFVIIILFIFLVMMQRQYIKAEILRQEHERNIEEAKFQFFFNLSHEIRTPLTLILNPIKELMARPNNDREEAKKYDMIYNNSMRILGLINQLLDLRKIEKGQMNMHFVLIDLANMVEGIMHNFSFMAEKKSVKLLFTSEMTDNQVAVDKDHFDKVMYNLYSNALKFTPEGGEVRTTLSQDNDNVVIEVCDTGCGIDETKLEQIFNRFYQIESDNVAAYTGTGIGLHFSRSIVNLHGGTIKAENRTDGQSGAIFRVVIPRHHSEETTVTDEEDIVAVFDEDKISPADNYLRHTFDPEKHKAATKKHILVVDDEREVNAYLVSELSKFYKVDSCQNGKEAYDMLLKDDYDAVVSDVMMPVMDGMTLCKKVKSNININHIPVILLTAKHSDEDRNKGLQTGADAYIAKPFDMEVLNNTLWGIIENRDRIMRRIGEMNNGVKLQKKINLKSVDEALMEKVTSYIDANISDPNLNVEKLASHVGMSRVHMHRKLKELTNQSARDFIRNIRLRQAGILLGEKKLNISDVAYALGFTNLSHFSTSFKDFYGVSPKEYMNEKLDNTQDIK